MAVSIGLTTRFNQINDRLALARGKVRYIYYRIPIRKSTKILINYRACQYTFGWKSEHTIDY